MAEYDALLGRRREAKEWQDYRAGLVCSVLANVWRDPKKGKALTPQDFMPGASRAARPRMTAEDMLHEVKVINARLGGSEG